ncbi:MAG: NAD(P)H-dependent oxidoreductase [Elusimicrobia bacterium]|nr:NAD(P)H-dependent oxidoreductase [Elusimicrobiota bacterium]
MTKPKILAFAGSLRKGSLNKKAAAAAAAAARAAGGEVELIDLADYPLPVYDGDLEEREGLPDGARRLKAALKAHDGLLLSTPEYNGSIPGPLKNAIDWASRPEPGEKPLAAFAGKTAALLSASPGALGGIRALAVARAVLENVGVLVIPAQVAVAAAHEAFADDGSFKDPRRAQAVAATAKRLVETVARLRADPAP